MTKNKQENGQTGIIIPDPTSAPLAEEVEVLGKDFVIPQARIANTVSQLIDLGEIAAVKPVLWVGESEGEGLSIVKASVPETNVDEIIRPGATSQSVDAGMMGKLPDNLRGELAQLAESLKSKGVSGVIDGSMPIWIK